MKKDLFALLMLLKNSPFPTNYRVAVVYFQILCLDFVLALDFALALGFAFAADIHFACSRLQGNQSEVFLFQYSVILHLRFL